MDSLWTFIEIVLTLKPKLTYPLLRALWWVLDQMRYNLGPAMNTTNALSRLAVIQICDKYYNESLINSSSGNG